MEELTGPDAVTAGRNDDDEDRQDGRRLGRAVEQFYATYRELADMERKHIDRLVKMERELHERLNRSDGQIGERLTRIEAQIGDMKASTRWLAYLGKGVIGVIATAIGSALLYLLRIGAIGGGPPT